MPDFQVTRADPRSLQEGTRAQAFTSCDAAKILDSSVRVEDVGAALTLPRLNGQRGVVFLGGLWLVDSPKFDGASHWTTLIGVDEITDRMPKMLAHLARFAVSQGILGSNPPMPLIAFTAQEVAASIQAEILLEVLNGRIPSSVPQFSALHDYVDANMLGLAGVCSVSSDCGECVHVLNHSQELVDDWILDHGIPKALGLDVPQEATS